MASNVKNFDRGSRKQKKSRSILVMSTLVTSIYMVQEGFYSNRTDFIRTAIRNRA